MKPQSRSSGELPVHYFEPKPDWAAWLNKHHSSSPGVWLQIAKKGTDVSSVSYDEAIEIALCYGWLDGQKQAHSDQFWLQKFARRSDKSAWSKINRDKALALIKAKKMKPAGLKEIERANAIVRKALGDMYRRLSERWWQAQSSSNLGENMASAFSMYAAGDGLDYDVIKQSPDAFEINVTGCRYAQFYKELGVPELGFLLVCSGDFPMAEGLGGDIELTRTQTIMQGASHCDFRYRRIKPKGGSDAD